MDVRFGIGYDVHKFESGRPLILGGIEIDFNKGLAGHSDADVVIHALIDALLGAAALRDIGFHFPDIDDSYKGISSSVLLRKTAVMLNHKGFEINNADITIICQKPKLSSYIPFMTEKLATVICILENQINVKATTTEGLGFTGREEGIAALAVVSIKKILKQ